MVPGRVWHFSRGSSSPALFHSGQCPRTPTGHLTFHKSHTASCLLPMNWGVLCGSGRMSWDSSDRALVPQQFKNRLDSRHHEGPLGSQGAASLNVTVWYRGTEGRVIRRAILKSCRSPSIAGKHCEKGGGCGVHRRLSPHYMVYGFTLRVKH